MSKFIGKVVGTSSRPSTVDSFSFWLKTGKDDAIEVGNIVTVEEAKDKVYGMVTEMRWYTDTESAMVDYLSHDLGQPEVEPPTLRQSIHVVTCEVIGASRRGVRPVSAGKVRLATSEEVQQAYGMDHIDDPVLIGVIPNGRTAEAYAPAFLSEEFLIGPEGAHVNFSGASGLATKTSAAVFLIRSILSRAQEKGSKIAVVAFNVKERDLLRLEANSAEKVDELVAAFGSPQERKMMEVLAKHGVSLRFDETSLQYFAPGRPYDPDRPHSLRQEGVTPFYWSLESVKSKKTPIRLADLIDPDDLDDRSLGVLAEIEDLIDTNGEWAGVEHFKELLNHFPPGKKDWRGVHSGHTVAKVKRLLRINTSEILRGLFVWDDAKEQDLPLEKLAAGQCFVIDIQTLNDKGKRIVFFNVLSRLARMLEEFKIKRDQGEEVQLDAVIVFVDELNKFAPSARSIRHGLKDQIIDIAARGRSVGLILFGAEQFASQIDKEVYGNCSTHIVGRTEYVELSDRAYKWISKDLGYVASTLPKGALLCKHALFSRPLLMKFPRPLHTYQKEDVDELLERQKPAVPKKRAKETAEFDKLERLLKRRPHESPVTYFRAAKIGKQSGIGQSRFTQWYRCWQGQHEYLSGAANEKKALQLLVAYLEKTP